MDKTAWLLILLGAFTLMCRRIDAKEKPTSEAISISEIVRGLASGNEMERDRAVQAAAEIAKSYSPSDFEWRHHSSLAQLRQELTPMVPNLIELLKHEDENVVIASIVLIRLIGVEARETKDRILELFRDDEGDVEIRMLAIRALLFVTPETEPVINDLLPIPKSLLGSFISEDDAPSSRGDLRYNTRAFAVQFYAPVIARELRASGHTIVELPNLTKLMSRQHKGEMRALAIAIIGELGDEGVPALKELWLHLDSDDDLVKDCAANAILAIDPNRMAISKIADRLMLDADERQRYERRAGSYIAERERTDQQRNMILQQAPDRIVKVCIEKLKYGKGPHRRDAVRDLAEMGPAARAALPILKMLLDNPNREIRQLAIETIETINRKSKVE